MFQGGGRRVGHSVAQNQKTSNMYSIRTRRSTHSSRGRERKAETLRVWQHREECCGGTRLLHGPPPAYLRHASRRDGGRVDRRLSKLLQHGIDLLEGRVDLLAKLAARQHHLVRVRARVSASRQHHLPAGCRLGVDWVAAGRSRATLARSAGSGGGLRRAEAGPAAGPSSRGQAGGARRDRPCSDRPRALPETKISSTILGCTCSQGLRPRA